MDPLAEQKRYYDARAGEYDEWWERKGRYDLGPEGNRAWRDEAEQIRRILESRGIGGDVLELAGGTGIWTEWLARRANRLTVLDASEPMLELNRRRLGAAGLLANVAYRVVDLFEWKPDRSVDAVFAGFWISHVPAERLHGHFMNVAAALNPGGAFMILEGQADRSRSHLQGTIREGGDAEVRTLNDGSRFRIIKRELDPGDLVTRLAGAGLNATVENTKGQFQLITATKRAVP